MQTVKVRRSGISADQAAEVLRFRLGGQYQVRADDPAQQAEAAGISAREDGTRVPGDGMGTILAGATCAGTGRAASRG